MPADDAWTSPSDLADYAYCPRSHWYRHHPPPEGPTRDSGRAQRRGARYHARTLGAERRRDERGGTYWIAVGLGLGLVVLGAAWWLHL